MVQGLGLQLELLIVLNISVHQIHYDALICIKESVHSIRLPSYGY